MNLVFIDFVLLRRQERGVIYLSFEQLVFGDGLFMKSPEHISLTYMDDNAVITRHEGIRFLFNRFDINDALANLTYVSGENNNYWCSVNKIKKRRSEISKVLKSR